MAGFTLTLQFDLSQESQRLLIYNNPGIVSGQGVANGMYAFSYGDTFYIQLRCHNSSLPTTNTSESTAPQPYPYVDNLFINDCTVISVPKTHTAKNTSTDNGIYGSYPTNLSPFSTTQPPSNPGTPLIALTTSAITKCTLVPQTIPLKATNTGLNGTVLCSVGTTTANASELFVVDVLGRWEFSIIVSVQYDYYTSSTATKTCYRCFRFDPEAGVGTGV